MGKKKFQPPTNPEIYQDGYYWNPMTLKFDLTSYDSYQEKQKRWEYIQGHPYWRNQETGLWYNRDTKQHDLPTYQDYCRVLSKSLRRQHDKNYRENNSEKVKCECGSEVCKYGLTTHRKSQKHQKFINRTET